MTNNTPYLDALRAATTRRDLAVILDVKLVSMTNVLYRIGVENQYSEFPLQKKGGGVRIISSPSNKLKYLQSKIADLLLKCRQEIFTLNGIDNNLSHGFEKNRSIITNASKHKNKKTILNLDLSNFFQSLTFPRVRGFLILNKDFKLHPDIATTIAHAACYKGSLPQGSPCSPVITNLVCNILDVRLAAIAKKYGCTYTRYADDITFSTNKKEIHEDLAVNSISGVTLGKVLRGEIERAKFEVNDSKTRISFSPSRHEVTGLTINKIVNADKRYVKKIRALAHSLYKNGFYNIKNAEGKFEKGTLQQLEGMFGFIDQVDKFNNIESKKNKTKEKYVLASKKLLEHRSNLNSREKAYAKFIFYKNFIGNLFPTIMTEGKTDRVYIKTALLSLASKNPEFIKIDDKTKMGEFNLTFINPNFKEKYFLDIEDGAASFNKFTKRYDSEYKSYYSSKAKNPVIMVLDNDTGPSELLNYIHNEYESIHGSVANIREKPFIHIIHNLYLILTPLGPERSFTEMEDLFDKETLEKKLEGKKFSRNKKINLKTEYDKDDFSLKIVKPMAGEINFEGFECIFLTIKSVLEHYKKLSKGT